MLQLLSIGLWTSLLKVARSLAKIFFPFLSTREWERIEI